MNFSVDEIASNVGVSFRFDGLLAGFLQALSISVGNWRVEHKEGLVKGLRMPVMMHINHIFLLSLRVSNTRLLKLILIEIFPEPSFLGTAGTRIKAKIIAK